MIPKEEPFIREDTPISVVVPLTAESYWTNITQFGTKTRYFLDALDKLSLVEVIYSNE